MSNNILYYESITTHCNLVMYDNDNDKPMYYYIVGCWVLSTDIVIIQNRTII